MIHLREVDLQTAQQYNMGMGIHLNSGNNGCNEIEGDHIHARGLIGEVRKADK